MSCPSWCRATTRGRGWILLARAAPVSPARVTRRVRRLRESRGEVDKNSSGGNSSEAEDLEMDLNLEGLNDCTCCICKSFNQENGNKLMECHTCQNLFHQECHLPAVSNEEANDPRLVWNCSDCSRKAPSIKPSKPISLSAPSVTSKGASGVTSLKSTSSRASPAKMSGGKPAGMAALAASYKSGTNGSKSSSGSSSRSSRSGSSSSSSSKGPSPSSANSGGGPNVKTTLISSADKRLQLMKKKAAARKIK